eukprot:2011165-Pyramimonas_sp.AAC.1
MSRSSWSVRMRTAPARPCIALGGSYTALNEVLLYELPSRIDTPQLLFECRPLPFPNRTPQW